MTTPDIAGLTDLRELGRGGFGVVYRAHQAAFGRDVAVKVVPGGSVDADAVRRFERECRATGAVSGHPNIVRVHDSGVTSAGDPYLVMDLLLGGTLGDRVRQHGPLDLGTAVAVGVGLSGALETAHRVGIVHRDVKPENVLFSAFGDAQLVDFGIARMQNAYESRTGSVSATLAHAAPEVIAGAEASPRSDLYSLGSVLYFALTAETAFGRKSESSLLPLINRISSDPVPDLRLRTVPDPVASVIERAMSKSPEDRFATSAEMGEALRSAAATINLPTMPVPIAAPVEMDTSTVPAPAGEVTKATSVRKREVIEPVAMLPAAKSSGRQALLVGALGVAIVLALIALVLARQGGNDGLAAGPTTTTTTSSATTSTIQDAATTVEASATSIEPTTSSPEVLPSTTSTRSPRTTTMIAPTTTAAPATTAKPITPPGAAVEVRSADPVAVDDVNGVPQHVRITLSWRAPFDNGGSGPTEYRVRCTLMQGSTPYTGPGDPSPCRGGVDVGTTPGNVTSFQPVVERVEPGPGTWLKWEITAINEAGAGGVVAASVTVPNFVGLKSWEAYPFGRAVGVAITGGQKSCGREPSTVCEQSRSAGINVAGGTNVVAYEQP